MDSMAAALVRLVRCPKCQELLLESPEHLLYRCGRCHATLQAKNCKKGQHITSGSPGKSTSQKNQLEHDSEYAKLTSSGQLENHSDMKDCSSNLKVAEQTESADCSIQATGDRNLNGVSSGEVESLSELNLIDQLQDQPQHDAEYVKSISSVQIENCSSGLNVKDQSEDSLADSECSLHLSAEEKMESTDCRTESAESKSFLNDASTGDSEFSSDLDAKEQVEFTDCSMVPSRSRNFMNGVSFGESLDLDNGKQQIESGHCTTKQPGSKSFLKAVSSSYFSCHDREEKSSEDGSTQMDEHDASQSPESQQSSRRKSSSYADQIQSDKSNPMKMNSMPLGKELRHPQEIPHHKSDNKRSEEKVEASGTTDHGNKGLSGKPGGTSKSTKAKTYHAYDGSFSSLDERNDNIPEQPLHLPKRSWFKHQLIAEFPSNKEKPRREDGLKDKKIGSNPEVRHQGRRLPSISSAAKHGLTIMDRLKKESTFQAQGRACLQDINGLHPKKNRTRSESGEFWSGESFQRGYSTEYENGSPSHHRHEEFSRRKSTCSPCEIDYFEQMELLSKLDKLRDQLSRSYNQRGIANGRLPPRSIQRVKQQPLCDGDKQVDFEVPYCYDGNNHRHPHAPYSPRQNGCQRCESSQMHFSGQGAYCKNHSGHSRYRSCREDWQCHPQFPPSRSYCKHGPFKGHYAHKCYQGSSSVTQQKHINSCFSPQRCQMHYQNQRFVDHDLQEKYYRDRRQSIKRHCQTIAGGAPFVICYRCCSLLQLPKDFLSQKRIHQLQCSACSQVLKFSLQNRTHLIPYNPNPDEPLPSEADNVGNPITGRNLESISYVNDSVQEELVSHSRDCEPSMCKSSSVKGGNLPFPILRGNPNDKKLPSGSCSEEKVPGKNKSVFKQCGNSYRTCIEESESTSASSNEVEVKISSLKQEVGPRISSSPLHQLMGYSSPNELINGHEI